MNRTLPRIVATCRLLALCAAVTIHGVACRAPAADVTGEFVQPDAERVAIRLQVQNEHRRDSQRYMRAAVNVLTTIRRWFGPAPYGALTLVDPPWRASPVGDSSVIVLDRTPWWSTRSAMAPELATARGIARHRWATVFDTKALPPWFVEGLAEYTARRAVAPLFHSDYLPPGYAMLELRYFGDFVPRFMRIRLLPESDGDALDAAPARAHQGGSSAAAADERRHGVATAVRTLATLERWIGTPVFDAVLTEFVRTFTSAAPTLDDFRETASAVAGQDLSWLLDPALKSSARFDYAVSGLQSARNPDGSFDTTVVVERRGDGVFAGTAAPRVGRFESGRGITVLVVFDDGERVVEAWDGREPRRRFQYRSAAPAASAVVDPDRLVLLDVQRTNNSRALASRTGTAATRWSMRWMSWLEQVLITYAVFV
jgi:hypothetical protein